VEQRAQPPIELVLDPARRCEGGKVGDEAGGGLDREGHEVLERRAGDAMGGRVGGAGLEGRGFERAHPRAAPWAHGCAQHRVAGDEDLG
jgi:hypothetical protein